MTAGTVPKRVSRLGGTKVVITASLTVPSSFSTPVSKSSASSSSNRSWEDSIQPSLSFDAVEVDAIRGQSGLIHGSQLMFNVHEDHSSGISIC